MTKERLRAYRAIKQEREQLGQMIEEIEASLYGPKIAKLDAIPGGSPAPGSSPLDAKVDKKNDLLALYAEKCRVMDAELLEIEHAIEVLDPRARTLIRLHYIQGLTWENVCVEMGYSWRQVHRIHAKALEDLKNQ
jgi:RNA polymerase sigma factor (sigma-70 family)